MVVDTAVASAGPYAGHRTEGTMDSQDQAAVVSSGPDPVERLTEQVTRLTEQVAALSTTSRSMDRRERNRCFACNRMGARDASAQIVARGWKHVTALTVENEGIWLMIATRETTRGHLSGAAGTPILPMSPQDPDIVMVAAVKAKAAIVWGKVGGNTVEMMLDSGSRVSLIHQDVLSQAQGTTHIKAPRQLRLVTALGDQLPIRGHVQGTIQLGELKFGHTLVVVPKLAAPVILGVDFLHANGLVLDFNQTPV